MSDYATSDLHLWDQGISNFCRGGRPAEEINKEIFDKWNANITNKDCVFVLGDLTMRDNECKHELARYIRSLNGRKILIVGNHDNFNTNEYFDIGFVETHTIYRYLDNVFMVHDPAVSVIGDRNKDKFLVGHVHTLYKECANTINVGVDVRDFMPVKIQPLLYNKN